ncbi:MFS transporter [Neobacillus bataviensis]|uniref:MFS transporter n=1 Tax=Neobacillus bataviensis TaxID=220685 RepID=UPI001CC13DB5|nr:MFS transporter [Neobacillus bataviensis]
MKKITKKEMIAFASGDLFGGGAQLIIGFFYLRFLTDVVRINPVLAGTVILVSKIWDAIADPVMGVVTDNTRTRFGRRKPYILAGFFLIVIAFTLLWFAPNFDSILGKFLFVLFSYIFYSTVSTIVTIPYTAFSSEISQDIKERDQVNGTRLFFSQVSSLIGAVLPMVIVGMFPEKTGYLFMGLIFSIFYAIPYLGIFLLCEERVPIPKEKRRFSLTEIISPFRVKTYRSLMGMYLSAFFVMDVVSAVFTYYMTYLIHREDLLEFVLGTMLITQIIMLFFVVMLAGKIGKPKTYMIGAAIFIVGTVALGFYRNSWPIETIFMISAVVGLGLTACIVIPWVMFPDVTDVSLLAFGERRSGSFAGFMAFLRKVSSAFGIWTIGLMLQLSGYMQPGEMIIPKNATAFINKEAMLIVDLQNDGNDDIRIDMKMQQVELLTNEKMDYVFDKDVLKIRLNNEQKDSMIVEKGLKVTDVYDFSKNSTLKSVNFYNQPESFMTGLRIIIFVLPSLLLLLAIFIARNYPLSRTIHERLLKFYEQKNKNKEEEEELKKWLV